MQPMGSTNSNIADRERVAAVVETLAAVRKAEGLGELTHDARNMVTALSLYCDLLEEPGVLSVRHRHYGNELRLVVEASRRLVEKLTLLHERPESFQRGSSPGQGQLFAEPGGAETLPNRIPSARHFQVLNASGRIDDFRTEIEANRNLLAAMAGPFIRLTIHGVGGSLPVDLDGEDLTRVLVNLVKNGAESIHGSGSIRIELAECLDFPGLAPCLMLVIEDSGHGIPEALLEKIFETGFTTRPSTAPHAGWSARHQGFGLSITRAIVEGAGGKIHAENCEHGGARFVIELPVRRP
jgi:signal transduction histidine kinase